MFDILVYLFESYIHADACPESDQLARKLSAAGFAQIRRNNSYANCLRMLAAGRVALVASADAGLKQKLQDAQVNAQEVQASAVKLGSDHGYIALSLGIPAPQVAEWRAALLRSQADGRFQKLYERYAQ